MLNSDATNTLSPSERLNRFGAAKPSTGEAIKTSLAAARRLRTSEAAPIAERSAVEVILASDSVESIASAAAQKAEQPLVGRETIVDLEHALAPLRERLQSIATSVEFTEAYVAAGITKNIADMLANEVKTAERAAVARTAYRTRLRALSFLVVALVVLLVAEVQQDFLGSLLFLAWEQGYAFSDMIAEAGAWAVGAGAGLLD